MIDLPPKVKCKCKFCGFDIDYGKEHMRYTYCDNEFTLITVCEECNNKIEEARGGKHE